MKICFRNAILAGIAALTVLSGCNKPGLDDTGFYDVKNPAEGTEISGYGETITVSFMADAAWDAELVTSDGGDWAEISSMRGNDAAGKGSVRIKIDETQDKEARAVEVYVTVQGYSRGLLCRLEQASALGSKLDLANNEQMNASLRSKYLWNEAYNQAFSEGKIDMGVRYKDFLSTNLMKLGDANLEDGGVYRDYSSLAGQRYVYSYIQEITAAKSKAPATRPHRLPDWGWD